MTSTPPSVPPHSLRIVARRLLIALLLVAGGYGCMTVVVEEFTLFMVRGRDIECETSLRAICTAALAQLKEDGRIEPTFPALGIEIERRNRFAFFLARSGPLEERSSKTVTPVPGAIGILPDTHAHPSELVPSLADVPEQLQDGVQLGLHGTCPKCVLTAVCMGDTDGSTGQGDPDYHVMSVSTVARWDSERRYEPCEPIIEVDDSRDFGSLRSWKRWF